MHLDGHVIGLVEDDQVMGESLVQSLSLEGWQVEWWKTGHDASHELRQKRPDVVICDIRLPDTEGHKLFRELAGSMSLPPFLFITAYGDIDQAVSLMREGAVDYLTKPFDVSSLISRIKSLVQRNSNIRHPPVLGVSPEICEVEATLRRICDLTTPLLISGETGVGKEVCARFLHSVSLRSKEPFVAVNCASLPHDVMERELFGYRGASGQSFHRGFAERARGGILFLDEVSELPITLQAKLLRLVERREYHRLGGEQQMIFHGRIICSTNRNLASLLKEKLIREDFYYRISGMHVEVPALRHRTADIEWLVEHYFEQFKAINHSPVSEVSPKTFEAALTYPWPGNVRELRNRIERAVALAKSQHVMPGDMFPDLAHLQIGIENSVGEKSFTTLSEARDTAERQQIERALRETGGHIIEAARLLGVSRTTLWEKMRRLGVSGHFR